MTPRRPRSSFSRSAQRMVLGLLMLVATVPAVLVAVVGWTLEQQRAQTSARAIAWLAEQQPGLLADGVRLPALGADSEWREVLDAAGRSLGAAGAAAARDGPGVEARHELRSAGTGGAHVIGQVRIARSLQPVLERTALVAVAGCLAAMALWLLAFVRPIALLRKAEQQLRALVQHDALTGLYNHDGLRHRVRRALARGTSSRSAVAVLVIDLDRFRIVNDSLGHPQGNTLLQGVADRIRAVTRPSDVLARLGADQFAILVEGIGSADAAISMARNLMRSLTPSYQLNGKDAMVAMSIGVAVAGDQADSVDALLKCADAAMRAAKASGGGTFKLYEPAMDARLQQRMDLEVQIRRALLNDEFFLVYQPIADRSGHTIVAVEALLRWADPLRGTVGPAEFIPVLEETGLIVPAGRRVLNLACRSAAGWPDTAGGPVAVSVNVSPRQFAEADFVSIVDQALAESGLAATRLQLEVTEGLLLDPSNDCLDKIQQLTQRGVRLAIDDFGMGYSSLAYLKRFQLHTLKIDRLFVRDIAASAQDAAIVRAIIDLGHSLGMRVTAEGVETQPQFCELQRLGCDCLQGYLFARPMPEAELLRRWGAAGSVARTLPGAPGQAPALPSRSGHELLTEQEGSVQA